MKTVNYKWIIVCFKILLTSNLLAQITVTNKGVAITNTQSSIYFKGDYIHDSTANIANGGTIYFKGDIINISNNRMFATNAGKVIIDGSQQQTISGDSAINFFKLEINKPTNDLILSQNIVVNDTLEIVNGNIDLNGNDIDMGMTGELRGETNNKRVFGNTGVIKARRFINHPSLSENVAGLGIYLSSAENFGYTLIERNHIQQTSNGDTSIFKYYNFIPDNSLTSELIDSLKLSYFDVEMIPGEYLYKIYASTDDGIIWKNKGGLVDTTGNFVITTTITPPAIGKFRASIFPIENFATCLPNDPNFISAIFLVSTTALDGDSVKLVQLTSPDPTAYSWNFGDGITSTEYSPFHIYNLDVDSVASKYQISMTVTNGVCSDTRKKNITVNPDVTSPRIAGLFSGIEYFNIYPNPNQGNFKIEVKTTNESDINIYILDMQGRLLDKKLIHTSSYKEVLNYENLSAGIYFIKLLVDNELRVVKIIKL